jgi:hypothetical protein
MAAFRDGLPANGKKFPDGSKVAKIEWSSKKNAESPYFVMVPDTLRSVSFIEKDTKRFPDTNGWAYAQFGYDAASNTFLPHGRTNQNGANLDWNSLNLWAETKRRSEKPWPKSVRPNGEHGTKVLRLAKETASRRIR